MCVAYYVEYASSRAKVVGSREECLEKPPQKLEVVWDLKNGIQARDDKGLNKVVVMRKEQKDGFGSYLRGSIDGTSLIRPKVEVKREGGVR